MARHLPEPSIGTRAFYLTGAAMLTTQRSPALQQYDVGLHATDVPDVKQRIEILESIQLVKERRVADKIKMNQNHEVRTLVKAQSLTRFCRPSKRHPLLWRAIYRSSAACIAYRQRIRLPTMPKLQPVQRRRRI